MCSSDLIRISRRGGGVAIYLRADLPFKIIAQSPTDRLFIMEYLFIEVSFCGTKILLGVAYSPPGVSYFGDFETLIDSCLPSYPHAVIMGDFNTCLYNRGTRSERLWDIVNGSNLTILPSFATFHFENYHSLLDLTLVSCPKRVSFCGQLPAPGFSHHDLIYLTYKLRSPKASPKCIFFRDYNHIDLASLLEDAQATDWHAISQLTTVDEKVLEFNNHIITLFDKHAPIKQVRIKRKVAPWLNNGIRKIMTKRDRAKVRYRADSCPEKWEAFRVLRNKCSQMCQIGRAHV